MSSCAIKGCFKNSKASGFQKDGISFHRFPKDPEIKEMWIKATHRENWLPTAFSVICSRHFTSDCISDSKKYRRLLTAAVPSLFLPVLSNNKEPLTHHTTSTSTITAVSIKHEPNNSEIDNDTSSSCSSTERILRRKITDLTKKLNQAKLVNKRVRSANTSLRKSLKTLKVLLNKLKSKGLLTQENVSIERLKISNRALVEKVTMLKKQLIEEKKKNRGVERNVVWCQSDATVEED